jgi:hypothetical protein
VNKLKENEKKYPKAYLPAGYFDENETRFVTLIGDLLQQKVDFRFHYYPRIEHDYLFACEVQVTHTSTNPSEVEFRMSPAKRFRSREQTEALVQGTWKKTHPTSVHWIKKMYEPASMVGANHMMTGVRNVVGFNPKDGFKVISEDPSVQQRLNEVLNRHQVWGVPTFGEVRFITI